MVKHVSCCVFLLLCFRPLSAQELEFVNVKDQDDVMAFIWQDEQAYTDFSTEKYKDYPQDAAIILKMQRYITTRKKKQVLRYWNIERQATYIQAKSAIEEFSTLAFSERGVKDRFMDYAVRIFKPSGQIVMLDASDFTSDGSEIKLVIPGIEVGDIIDYYYFVRDDMYVSTYSMFDPDEFYFAHDFPVLHNHIEFVILKDVYIKFISLNGAPVVEWERLQNGFQSYAKATIDDYDRPGFESDSRWVYPYLAYPVIRFRLAAGKFYPHERSSNLFEFDSPVTYSNVNVDKSMFLSNYLKPLKQVSELKSKDERYIEDRMAMMKLSTPREKVQAYYKQLNYLARYSNFADKIYLSEREGMAYMAKYCRSLGIDSSVDLIYPRYYGGFDDIMVQQEIQRVLRIEFDEGRAFVWSMNSQLPFNYYPGFIEGSDRLTLLNKNYEGLNLNYKSHMIEGETRISPHERNRSDIKLRLELDKGDALSGRFEKSDYGFESKGVRRPCKEDQAYCNTQTEFIAEQYYSVIEGMSETQLYEEEDLRVLVEQDEDDFPLEIHKELARYSTWMRSTVQRELESRLEEENIGKLDTVRIINFGLDDADQGFAYEAQTSFKDLVQAAGSNKIIEIGRLIGGQVQVNQEARDRHSNVYYDYARSYNHEIRLAIPVGFTVEGIEGLAYSVDNKTGGFTSSAQIEGAELVVNASKYYKLNEVELADWPLLLEMLDAAYDFSQKKILLKKN